MDGLQRQESEERPRNTIPKKYQSQYDLIDSMNKQNDFRPKTADQLEKEHRRRTFEKMKIRRWKSGDVYSPHDLSSQEADKWRTKTKPETDVFDVLNINPMDEYKVYSPVLDGVFHD